MSCLFLRKTDLTEFSLNRTATILVRHFHRAFILYRSYTLRLLCFNVPALLEQGAGVAFCFWNFCSEDILIFTVHLDRKVVFKVIFSTNFDVRLIHLMISSSTTVTLLILSRASLPSVPYTSKMSRFFCSPFGSKGCLQGDFFNQSRSTHSCAIQVWQHHFQRRQRLQSKDGCLHRALQRRLPLRPSGNL